MIIPIHFLKSKIQKIHIIEKMNESEKLNNHENNVNKLIYNSENIKIQEIKIGNDNKNENNENNENKSKKSENIIEDIDNIDESFFDKLEESLNSMQLKEGINKEKEISSKEIIDEII